MSPALGIAPLPATSFSIFNSGFAMPNCRDEFARGQMHPLGAVFPLTLTLSLGEREQLSCILNFESHRRLSNELFFESAETTSPSPQGRGPGGERKRYGPTFSR